MIRMLLNRLRGHSDGSASVEFVILFPVFIAIFLSTFEASMLLVRQSMLERYLDLTIRELRLGQGETMTHALIKDDLCARTSFLPNCGDNLVLELMIVSQDDYVLPSHALPCVDRANQVIPVTTFDQGDVNDLMVVRACFVVDPMFPTSGLGLHLTRDTGGDLFMTAASAFVNEPV